jgi:hydroxymethylpyrimidine pyrophosphatase-like HAD family hydrolase
MNLIPSCSSADNSKIVPSVIDDSDFENSVQPGVLPAELEFYESYHWSLNPHLTVGEAIAHLGEEAERLSMVTGGWEIGEVATNIFLLSCGLLNRLDAHLRGFALRLPRRLEATVVGRGVNRFVETISDKPWSQRGVGRCRDQWLSDLNNFLSVIVSSPTIDAKKLADSARQLTAGLALLFPTELLAKRLGIPSPFAHLDLTPNDVLRLGDRFMQRFPERTQPLLIVGLRTSGSYFAPLLRALLETEGYRSVGLLTLEPLKGVGRHEERKLKQFAARGYWARITDDPPDSSRSLHAAFDIVQRAGFAAGNVKFLAPTHPASTSWFKTLPESNVITLPPEQWHKQELLNSKATELRLGEYFRNWNFARISVTASHRAAEFNARMHNLSSDDRGHRLKRIFEVHLETSEGKKQTKYILAKSVGWGWFSYRAFLMGCKLSEFVPPILGLRDGILYMEWIPPAAIEPGNKRNALLHASAAYVAARVRRLSLSASAAGMDFKRYNNGSRTLAKALSQAYGLFSDLLMRSRIDGQVRDLGCPFPTLIDGNMLSNEWILGPRGPLKTDYEHHGMGKTALNLTDPAYDLADTILNLALSPQEESRLIRQYIAESGDAAVEQRLFIHKLLAGLWAMSETQQRLLSLRSPRGRDAQRDDHLHFMNAWNFLTAQAARYCGSFCRPRTGLRWRAPMVVLDVDGVLDRRVFGFPCTTAAGIEALSLLSAHEFSVALNTARSVAEVKDYCKAYPLAGGVAEHGSYLWDAVRQRERVLISVETVRQLEKLRRYLEGLPGVFLDERHQYSIRAFTYHRKTPGLTQSLLGSASKIGDGSLAPISTHILHQLLVDLGLDRLTFHHTRIDTTVIAKEADKGTGLAALRDWVLADDAETIAVGDTEHDLPMFRMASRSFAPSNINCRRLAQLCGCQISQFPYQRGLLEIVTKIIHSNKERCERCFVMHTPTHRIDDIFMTVLQAADQTRLKNLAKAMFNPAAYGIFMR